MAEVTGTVGLLGGVVRELARNVAAQNRDVADIRDSLQQSPPGAGAPLAEDRPRAAPGGGRARSSSSPIPRFCACARPKRESELRRTRVVTQAFEADRIELHLQPVVALPQRKVRFYEALARLRLEDGTLLAPGEFLVPSRADGPRAGIRPPGSEARHRGRPPSHEPRQRGHRDGQSLAPLDLRDPGFIASLSALAAASRRTLPARSCSNCRRAAGAGSTTAQKRRLGGSRKRRPAAFARSGAGSGLRRRVPCPITGVRFLKLPAEMLIAAAKADAEAEVSVRDFASILRRAGHQARRRPGRARGYGAGPGRARHSAGAGIRLRGATRRSGRSLRCKAGQGRAGRSSPRRLTSRAARAYPPAAQQ